MIFVFMYISYCTFRNTLGNDDVIDFINGRMLFWSCNTNSPEGYRGRFQINVTLQINNCVHLKM